jgi:hypothetical protein
MPCNTKETQNPIKREASFRCNCHAPIPILALPCKQWS